MNHLFFWEKKYVLKMDKKYMRRIRNPKFDESLELSKILGVNF